jgi:hypothetical protein
MIIVRHRVNDVRQLINTPHHLGVEVDIRSNNSGLYLAHDPFCDGESLGEYLSNFKHRLIVLNVKEEGLEEKCLELLRETGVPDYFFLDQSMPFLIRRGLQGIKDGACRISEYESMATVQNLREFCEWVWVDSFHSPGLDLEKISDLKEMGLKVCLVSPELHGSNRNQELVDLIHLVQESDIPIDAVCTKFPEAWAI